MPGASLYELWKYHERVRAILASDLEEFRKSYACGTTMGFSCTACTRPGSSQIPSWLDHYIRSIEAPNQFDPAELNVAMARHIQYTFAPTIWSSCQCAYIPSQSIRDFWEALASAVHGSFEKVNVVTVIHGVAYNVEFFYRQSQLYLLSRIKRTPKSKSI